MYRNTWSMGVYDFESAAASTVTTCHKVGKGKCTQAHTHTSTQAHKHTHGYCLLSTALVGETLLKPLERKARFDTIDAVVFVQTVPAHLKVRP